MESALILLLALGIDLLFGEPSNRFHPVAWLGGLINLSVRWMPQGNLRQFLYGTAVVLLITGIATTLSYLFVAWLMTINIIAYIVVVAMLLKYTFSLRGLRQAAEGVKRQLQSDDAAGASGYLQALVSRDTSRLGREQMISATVESVAENSCDSYIAPLFYFLIFGLPGAVAYRVINTFDAMIGYHGRWEYAGKFAARLDDVVNYIPSRLSAMLLVLAAFICRRCGKRAWQCMVRDHAKTESPNAGWTMSAMAGALGIRLEKSGHYVIGDGANALTLRHIDGSVSLLYCAALIWTLLSAVGLVIYHAAA